MEDCMLLGFSGPYRLRGKRRHLLASGAADRALTRKCNNTTDLLVDDSGPQVDQGK